MSDFKKADELVKKNKKKEFVDDGRSITDMNVEGFSWYVPKRVVREKEKLSDLKITRKERIAMIKGALMAILPVAFLMIVLFFGVFMLLDVWLN